MSAAAVAVTALCSEWTPVQLAKFLDYVTAHRLCGCFALTLLGLRREEVGGLCWSDIELDTGALHIRRARLDVNGRDTIVPTKTERSARGLPVPPRELAMLRAMRSVHLRERLFVGRPPSDADLLLSRVDGTWLPVRDYSREFAAQRTAAGFEAITLGKLRHSNISRMCAAGIAAAVVAAWHGHTERMIQAVYGRVTDERLTAAADVFSSAVRGCRHGADATPRPAPRYRRRRRSPEHRRDHLANQTTMPHQSMNGQPRTLRSPGRAITKMKLAETVQEAIDRTTEEPAASSETGRGKVPTTLTAKGRRPR